MPKKSNVVFIYNQDDVDTWINEIIEENLDTGKVPNPSAQYYLLKEYKELVIDGDLNSHSELEMKARFDFAELRLPDNTDDILTYKCADDNRTQLEYMYRLADVITNKKEAHKQNAAGFHQTICLPLKKLLDMKNEVKGNFADKEKRMNFLKELHKLYVSADRYLASHSENSIFHGSDGSARISYVKDLKSNLQCFLLGFNYRYMEKEKKEQEKEKIAKWYYRNRDEDGLYIKVSKKAENKPVISQRTYKMSSNEELVKFDQVINPDPQNKPASSTRQMINEEYDAIRRKISKYAGQEAKTATGLDKLVKAAAAFAGTFSKEHNQKETSFNKMINEPLQAYAMNPSGDNADTALTQLYYDACLYLNTHKNPHTDKGQACRAFANMIKNVAANCIHSKSLEYTKQMENDEKIFNKADLVFSF